MNIEQCHKNWTELGSHDPKWVVLTDPGKSGNKWGDDEFLLTGEQEVDRIVDELRVRGIVPQFVGGRALDFGCGLGRLSQALARHFSTVDGVDISASMVEQARVINRQGPKVSFHLNIAPDLSLFPSKSFDFVLTLIALQHTPSRFQERYLSEFMRLLKPGGILCFNVMQPRTLWRRLIPEWVAEVWRSFRHKGKAYIPIYPVVHSQVIRALGPEAELVSYDAKPIEPPFSRRLQYGTYLVRRR